MASLSIDLSLGRPKRRKIASPVEAFADPDTGSAAPLPTDDQKSQTARSLQDEGNRHAEAGQHSAAIRLYDRLHGCENHVRHCVVTDAAYLTTAVVHYRALELQPGSAVLHELKAQVFLAAEQPWPALRSAAAATK